MVGALEMASLKKENMIVTCVVMVVRARLCVVSQRTIKQYRTTVLQFRNFFSFDVWKHAVCLAIAVFFLFPFFYLFFFLNDD